MANLLSDENFDLYIVRALRGLGHDVLTVQEAGFGNRGIDDAVVLDLANVERRALVTFDKLDFLRLHRLVRFHCGIIICSDDRDRLALAQRIHDAVVAMPDLTNQLIRVYRPNNS